MRKKTAVSIAHSSADLGKPAEYTRGQLSLVKDMIRQVAAHTMGGMHNIVKPGDRVLIKINTVIPVPANAGFTTDPRMLEALIELVKEQRPARIQIGERCAMGADTMEAMRVCGIVEVAERTGVELCPFEHAPFDMYKIDRPISFNEFPVPRPVREADAYIGLPKMKVHVHTTFTGAMKLQFGNLPDYDWMVRCHRDDIYQKIVNLTRAANPKWFVMDSLCAWATGRSARPAFALGGGPLSFARRALFGLCDSRGAGREGASGTQPPERRGSDLRHSGQWARSGGGRGVGGGSRNHRAISAGRAAHHGER
jgi:uncharacterized protein (DUF362 family)